MAKQKWLHNKEAISGDTPPRKLLAPSPLVATEGDTWTYPF